MINSLLIKKIWLKQDEVPILVIRSSAANWFWSWLSSGLLLAAAFFLMYFLWQQEIWGLGVFGLMIILSLAIFIRAYVEYYYTAWVLTNLRLIDFYRRGFLHQETSEVIYDKLQEVYSRQEGSMSHLFNVGDVYLTLANSKVKFKLSWVRGYDRAAAEILLQQENYQKNLLDEHERRSQFLLLKIKKKLGEKAFKALIGD